MNHPTDVANEVTLMCERIELLEAARRIAALEAALRKIMDHPAGLYEKQYEIARAALDKDAGQ